MLRPGDAAVPCSLAGCRIAATLLLLCLGGAAFGEAPRGRLGAAASASDDEIPAARLDCLRRAIVDLRQTYGGRYPRGGEFLSQLDALEQKLVGDGDARRLPAAHSAEFQRLQREALLANPLLDFDTLLVVKRKPQRTTNPFGSRTATNGKPLWFSPSPGADIGLPSNHECNSSLARLDFDNELAAFSPRHPAAPLRTIYRPDDGGYVGEVDLHWNADRMLFTRSDAANWKVFEIGTEGGGLRQVFDLPDDVDSYDACYLPDGRIVFGSSAAVQAVPCWHGLRQVTNLFTANAEGSEVRRLCFDQDHDLHPVVVPNGQVLFNRWDYTGINHIFLRQLMLMNPDGTGQRAIYGSGSWYPNALYFARPLPGDSHKLVCILSGYHGPHKMGQLVVLDVGKGWREAEGIVQRISGRGDPIRPIIKDDLVGADWPKFLHPYPLSDKHFLVACWPDPKSSWAIYLADVFDNLVLLREEPGYALLEPVPVVKQPRPPVIPDRVDPAAVDATVYVHDIYAGPGLAGVPRGTVTDLRVVAYHFGFPHLAGPHLVGRGGPWEVMRIVGTVPVEADGSAKFRVPANTPLALQPLDSQGKAVQLMRSWFTAMPGEVVSCIGCHENPSDAAPSRAAIAQRGTERTLQAWHGPARGFDFEREVQPVLDHYCVGCHGPGGANPDLRPLAAFREYAGLPLDKLGVERMYPEMLKATGGRARYTPAYEALIRYVRRVGVEDDVSLLTPGEYYADTSELLQILRKGHYGVRLDAEAYDRLATWIDLNAPCHGTWGDIYPIPEGMHERRMELARLFGGPASDPEAVPELSSPRFPPAASAAPASAKPVKLAGWPFDPDEARRRQEALGPDQRRIDLGSGVSLELARVPAGRFVMGSTAGPEDEQPPAAVEIAAPYWMGVCEVTNEQYRRFDPSFDPGYYGKRHARADDKGLMLDDPRQPAVRVSWQQAIEFCRWLSAQTGQRFTLPTEAQWEWACRAGSDAPLSYGGLDDDFSAWANLADAAFARGDREDGTQVTGGIEHLLLEGADLAERRFADGHAVTAPVGSFRPNAWGLYDMHGNAAEWTRSTHLPYPYREDDGRNDAGPEGQKVVRGGSFFDRPARSHAGYRLPYAPWQRPFNVGFRVVCVGEDADHSEEHGH